MTCNVSNEIFVIYIYTCIEKCIWEMYSYKVHEGGFEKNMQTFNIDYTSNECFYKNTQTF